MRRSAKSNRSNRDAIDWPAVLGPLHTAAFTVPAEGRSLTELAALESATWAHVRRAVRPRPQLAPSELPFATEPVPWFPRGRFLTEPAAAAKTRPGAFLQYAAGDYYIQDAGSMLALALCQATPGQWLCDTCAAPGGKSTALLESLDGQGLLVANEVIRSRLGILQLALARSGYGNQLLMNLDVAALQQVCGRSFDCVLVDAPCTGQTMVARGKQSLAAFGPVQIAHSSRRQQRILREAAGLVKPAGRLVYSTCAYSYAENEQIVLDFIAENPQWILSAVPGLDPWRSPVAEGCYRVWPHRDGCSGAFAALLINGSDDSRAAGAAEGDAHQGPKPHRSQQAWQRLPSLPTPIDWLAPQTSGQWYLAHRQLHRFDPQVAADWIHTAVSGCLIAESKSDQKSERWTPQFAAAMLRRPQAQPGLDGLFADAVRVPVVELDDSQAIRYVAGEALACDPKPTTWCLVAWRGRPLAWGKMAQGTLKNHYPKALRQRVVV